VSRRLVDGQLPKRSLVKTKIGDITDLTPELIAKIIKPLQIGASVTTASAFNGVHYDTMRMWVLKGKEHPETIYGELIRAIEKAIAEWEVRDISVLEKHAMGAPAEYQMDVVFDEHGQLIRDASGNPVMQVARNKDGNPIVKRSEIKADWKAALERLSRRKPRYWASRDTASEEAVLTYDNKKPETREAITFEQRIAEAIDKLEEDV
jgi:hypothetical protein